MALYLNTNAVYKDFQMPSGDKYFVDKSDIIEKVIEGVEAKGRFLRATRPRCFGKIPVVNVLGVIMQ
ncbi:MAG: hypothetical protein K2L18_11040 [Acetatifactor sp.]|nr:hypothetical protein [Acetatifactor sp.]